MARYLVDRPGIQVDTQGVSPQDPRMFQTNLGSLDLSYRENVMDRLLHVVLTFPVCLGIQGPSKIPIALLLVGVVFAGSHTALVGILKRNKRQFLNCYLI